MSDEKVKRGFFGSVGNGIWIFALLFILGLVMVFLFGGEEKAVASSATSEGIENGEELEIYASELEKSIEALISEMSGINSVKALVTLESGRKKIYATDKTEKTSGTTGEKSEEYTFKSEKSGEKEPVLLYISEPEVRGVAIVCTGGDTAAVQTKIINLISCALNLPTNRIYVVG